MAWVEFSNCTEMFTIFYYIRDLCYNFRQKLVIYEDLVGVGVGFGRSTKSD